MTGINNKVLLTAASLVFFASLAQIKAQPGSKMPFIVKRGDCEMTVGAKAKFESYFEDNAYLLNKDIPDENEYFKESIDVLLSSAYGKEKYGHKAVEMSVNMRHKGVWGKALAYADKDSGPIGPSSVKFNDKVESIFGTHNHTSGKPLIWFKDAWLRFSFNAAFNSDCQNLQFLKLGWFFFDMGRGIAFGGAYGLNKELIGIYSYPEDKSAPGINLHGTIIKDCLDYDIYYSKFEERSKSLADTINLEKRHIVGRSATPWRGINKDDEVIAGRLQWKALKDGVCGSLDLEPYVFFNAASDQKIEIAPDSKAYWGSYGLAAEYSYGDFEFGGEAAFNYGKQTVFNIDRNKAFVVNQNGTLVEQYTHILNGNPNNPASQNVLVTTATKAAAKQPVYVNGAQIDNTGFFNANDRFRPEYKNKYAGWMVVLDSAYTVQPWHLKFAATYGYASGDNPPNELEVDKTYKGFIGLHEYYVGKRVASVFLLDARLIKIPVGLDPNVFESQGSVAAEDTFFSDLQFVGGGVTWTPKCFIKDLSINPNVLAYWKAKREHKFIPPVPPAVKGTLSDELASTFMGTELNIIASFTILKDLKLLMNGAIFIPGQYFKDVTGVPVGKDIFDQIVQDDRNDVVEASQFRLSSDTAYHLNFALEYKF